MARTMGRTDWYLPFLPLLVFAAVYGVAAGEWGIFVSLAGVAVAGSFGIPIDRYYGEATTLVERLVLAFEHLLALGLLVFLVGLIPRLSDASTLYTILLLAAVASFAAYFVRGALAWRRFRHEGAR